MTQTIEHLPAGHEALERAIAIKGLIALSDAIGVRYQIVQGWRDKKRRVATPVEHCASIEVALNGAVTRQQLRPDDWHRIWPELAAA